MNTFWKLVGTALLLWVAWDLYAGYTLLTEFIYRDQEPALYWVTLFAWFALAISCFFNWNGTWRSSK